MDMIRVGKLACATALIAILTPLAWAQDAPTAEKSSAIRSTDEAKQLEARLREVASKCRPTQVALHFRPSRGMTGSSGSGTVIESEGWILTAGHVGDEPGRRMTITFEDGTTTQGMTAGMIFDGTRDCGLIRFKPSDRVWPAAKMVSPKLFERGHWICSFGHTYGTEKEQWMAPAMRMGRLLGQDDLMIAVDSPFAGGDSGGGVFSIEGDLVGVISTAGAEPWNAQATSMEFIQTKMDWMKSALPSNWNASSKPTDPQVGAQPPESSGEMPTIVGTAASETDPPDENQRDRPTLFPDQSEYDQIGRESSAMLEALASACQEAMMSIVVILVDSRATALGTIIDSEGTVLTKRSELPSDLTAIDVTMPDGVVVRAEAIAVDGALDLALLRTGELGHQSIQFQSGVTPELGAMLLSPAPDGVPMALGVCSVNGHETSRRDITAPFLGVGVRAASAAELQGSNAPSGIVVEQLTPGSTAEGASIRVGDVVLAIDGEQVPSQAELGELVRRRAIGAPLHITLWRTAMRVELTARPTERPRGRGPSPSTRLFPSSRRPSGFGSVIQHDSLLTAHEMGGPLLDLDGKVVGLNIARVDRTRTYALESARVAQSIDTMRARIATKEPIDPLMHDVVPISINATGQTALHAGVAGLSGASMRYRIDPDRGTGSASGFREQSDALRWQVRVESKGTYIVEVLYQLRGRAATDESIRVRAGTAEIAAEIHRTGRRGDVQRTRLGTVLLLTGEQSIELSAVDAPANILLGSLILSRVEAEAPKSDQNGDAAAAGEPQHEGVSE